MLQQNEAWFQDRLGYATASCFKLILAKGSGKTRQGYLERVVMERLTGERSAGFSSYHTERGTEQEPLAKLAYEAETGNIVQEVGFIRHESLMAGCSPDGLIDEDGGMEIKSVIPSVQRKTVQKGGYPTCHKAQIQGNLWITGREYWDFVSYSPECDYGLYIFRVERDEGYIANLEAKVRGFLEEVDYLLEGLNG